MFDIALFMHSKHLSVYLVHSRFLMLINGAVYSGVLQQACENEHKGCDDVNIKSSGVWHIWSRTSSVKEVPHGKNSYDSKRDSSRGGVGIDPERDPTKKNN